MNRTTLRNFAKDVYRTFFLRPLIVLLSLKERVFPVYDDAIPVPPPQLRQLISSGRVSVRKHIEMGRLDAANLAAAFTRFGVPSQGEVSVLDFGCGCGRTLRHFRALRPEAQLYGSDIDRALIEWSQANLDFAEFRVNPSTPPTHYASSSFDGIYLVSVFTHLDEDAQTAWLSEFNRLLRPNGVLLITVIPLAPQNLEQEWDFKNDLGLVYSYRRTEAVKRSWVGKKDKHAFYIDTQHSEKYCREKWGKTLEFVEFRDDLWVGKQALVALRKKP